MRKIVATAARGINMNGIPEKGHTVAQLNEAMERVSKMLGEEWLATKTGAYYVFTRGDEAGIKMSARRGIDWAIVNGIPGVISTFRFVER